jgi:hypothetical protein
MSTGFIKINENYIYIIENIIENIYEIKKILINLLYSNE